MKSKEKYMQKTLVVWFGALICCALWGSAFPCIKIGYELFGISSGDTASQILFAGCRFTLAGILAILLGSILSRKPLIPRKESWGKICRLSMLQTVLQYLFFYVGLAHTSGVKASIIGGVNVFIAILVASLLFRQEKLTGQKVLGCVIGFAGVVLINLTKDGIDMSMSFTGEGFIFLSTIAYAFSSVFLKRYSEHENPVVLSGYQFVLGGVIMSICGALAGGSVRGFSPASVGILIYLALISAVAYSLWGILLQYNPVSKVAVFGFMNPVFGVILSAILLGEAQQAAGFKSVISLVLVCIGIYIVNYVRKEKQ
ncbi:DMT family transporter [Hespellia stercorisuis]|uniref:Permease of the drug/metabolite transporter (DMT) superfamily n=1 Tax=Hespellia stercorisuis DSM 15480 TaxID=1121950 RepID=A0A1M6JGJ5_9FIRM|nr:DMT family transporter [Hespellia stercorisuis]SHJ45784.1 Permease of the drug/metabolite transporter (DMT) superfamily [Hespellia stercorisuis DSM 15480]